MSSSKLTMKETVLDFVMASRELLMGYYKGTTVDNLANPYYYGLKIREQSLTGSDNGRAYDFERYDHGIHRRSILSFKGLPLIDLETNPHIVTFRTAVFKLTPELTAAEGELRKFYKTWLSGVELKENNDQYADPQDFPREQYSIEPLPSSNGNDEEEDENPWSIPIRPSFGTLSNGTLYTTYRRAMNTTRWNGVEVTTEDED